MALHEDPQTKLWDREADDPELVELVEAIWETKQTMRGHSKRQAQLKKRLEALGLADGERLRVGPFVLTGVARAGGGFEVPEWETVSPVLSRLD